MPTRSIYGLQADAWGALLPGRASLEDGLFEKVAEAIQKRKMPSLNVTIEGLTFQEAFGWDRLLGLVGRPQKPREHLIARQNLGEGGWATVALRIAKRGEEDLEISWRLFEVNEEIAKRWRLVGWGLIAWAFVFACMDIPLIALAGIGLFLELFVPVFITAGIALLVISQRRTTATTYQQFDARILASTVDYCLMNELAKLGVSTHELRVLREAQVSGLGRLEAVSPLEGTRDV